MGEAIWEKSSLYHGRVLPAQQTGYCGRYIGNLSWSLADRRNLQGYQECIKDSAGICMDGRTHPLTLFDLLCYTSAFQAVAKAFGLEIFGGNDSGDPFKASGTLVDNVYIFDHFDKPLKDIGKNLGIDFSRQNLTVGEVRSLLAYVKQSS